MGKRERGSFGCRGRVCFDRPKEILVKRDQEGSIRIFDSDMKDFVDADNGRKERK